MKPLLVIPARWHAARFPGKALAPIRQPGGGARALVVTTLDAARREAPGHRIVVATDDARIAAAVGAAGGVAEMTSPRCRNGTERVAELAARLDQVPEIIVNLQGDAPMIPAAMIGACVAALAAAPEAAMATPVIAPDGAAESALPETSVWPVAARRAPDGTARAFARRRPGGDWLAHVGLYVYRREALAAYARHPESVDERRAGLEQLRFLALGLPVLAVPCPAPPAGLAEVNAPEDVAGLEAALARASALRGAERDPDIADRDQRRRIEVDDGIGEHRLRLP